TVVRGTAFNAPYTYDFRNNAGFGYFTIVDANADGCTWMSRDAYGVVCMYSPVNNSDDWLISPPLKLTKGVRYEVSTDMASAMDAERFEIKYGESADPEAIKNVVIEPSLILDGTYRRPETFTGYLTPEQDGEYYVGIHCISDPDKLFCYCAEFNIKPASTVGVSDVTLGNCTVSGQKGEIVVSGAAGEMIEVYSVAGACVARQEAGATTAIAVNSGLYMVKVGTAVAKVMVR
ncbi:MAG: choice-of-anchor J domain-containing protein, partial [Muribaculaceae bacterium]|nr:choice-of-anchor J domain-containing protein [Muribaculaceae bacterium]